MQFRVRNFSYLAMGVVIILLIAATVVEKLCGTEFAHRWFYTAPWTIVLWGVSAVGCLLTLNPRRPAWLLHVSFTVILAGALVTHLWGRVVGDIISYVGYGVLFVSMIYIMVRRDSRWRGYLRRVRGQVPDPPAKKSVTGSGTCPLTLLIIVVLCFMPLGLDAGSTPHTVQRAVGQAWGQLYVWHNGRVCPMHTLDVELCLKLYGSNGYDDLTADQVILGHLLYPDQWSGVPLKKCRKQEERDEQKLLLRQIYDARIFGIPLPMLELVAQYLSEGRNVDAYRTLQKIRTIQYRQMSPGDRVSDRRFYAELWFVDFGYTKPFAIALTILGVLMFLIVALSSTGHRDRVIDPSLRSRVTAPVPVTLLIIEAVSLLFLTVMLGVRWYITGHIPMVSGHETMQTMTWLALAGGVILSHKPLLSSGLLLVSAMAMLVSMMSASNPQLTALIPALQSPLLSVHVSVIMLSYTLFALLMVINLVALFRPNDQIYYLSQVILYPSLFLLITGIFIGAVWAGQSWGRLWGWDPKEVWALITMLIYAIPIHCFDLKPLSHNRTIYHLYMVIAFASVAMTYFGVNYILGGLHSYS